MTKPTGRLRVVTVSLELWHIELLDQWAREDQRSRSSMLRLVLDQVCSTNDRPVRVPRE